MKKKDIDLFEDVREQVGATYISDLKFSPYRENIPHALEKLARKRYPMYQVLDFLLYVKIL